MRTFRNSAVYKQSRETSCRILLIAQFSRNPREREALRVLNLKSRDINFVYARVRAPVLRAREEDDFN